MKIFKILIIVIAIVLAILPIFIFKDRGGKIIYTGYLVRNWEAIYLVPNSPLTGNKDDDKIWVKEEDTDWLDTLTWQPIDANQNSEYAKVRATGVLYGPGSFGGVPGYKYEIKIDQIGQIN